MHEQNEHGADAADAPALRAAVPGSAGARQAAGALPLAELPRSPKMPRLPTLILVRCGEAISARRSVQELKGWELPSQHRPGRTWPVAGARINFGNVGIFGNLGNERAELPLRVTAGIDLGGTAVNYTLIDLDGHFLIDGLCEHPARSVEGPDICLQQIADGLAIAVQSAGVSLDDVIAGGSRYAGAGERDGRAQREGLDQLRACPVGRVRPPRQPVHPPAGRSAISTTATPARCGATSPSSAGRRRRRSPRSSAPAWAAA